MSSPNDRSPDGNPGGSGSPLRCTTTTLPSRDPDDGLAEQARAGDVEAYRALVRRHRTGMYRSALRRLGDDEGPDEADITARLRDALALFARTDPT